jgi:hypothetical protein
MLDICYGLLQIIEEALQVRWKAAGDQCGFIDNSKKPPRELGTATFSFYLPKG